MSRTARSFAFLAALALVGSNTDARAQSSAPSNASPGGFSIASMDRSANACTDFFQYACGGWIRANPIPADQSVWGTFNTLADRNREILKSLLDGAAAKGASATANERMIGDFYATCMDEPGIEKLGAAPLKAELDRIAAIASKADLPATVGRLHASGVGVFFGFGSEQDFKDATRVLAIAGQGGLGLPDRDYYFRDDERTKGLRTKYVAHVANMFRLLGDAPDAAAKNADVVMSMETALAKNALDVVSQRDPNKIYHLMTSAEFAALMPAFDFQAYLATIRAPKVEQLNAMEPEFAKGMSALVAARGLADLKTYLRWHVAHDAAPYLSPAFVNENFDFYGKALTGAKELRPRWKRCIDATDNAIGEALGAAYVEKTFGPEGRRRMNEMVANLTKAMDADIRGLDWMSAATKTKALEKLKAVANKVGYPDRWKDYSSVKIVRGDHVGNLRRATEFEFARQLAKIGKPVDRGEFTMTPPTVNAYYNPLMNDINFPVGILQPPFFDLKVDDAVNYGGIGGVIGHELTHGFDDQGSQFAANGNLANWWTDEDRKAFDARTGCIADQYGAYTALDGTKQNGKLTMGEDVADNGGLRIAYMALMETLKGTTPASIDGLTPEQRFFLGWGQVWCSSARAESETLQVQTDPHSLPRYRVNGVVSNMPEFAKAFACPAGSPMVRAEKSCRAW